MSPRRTTPSRWSRHRATPPRRAGRAAGRARPLALAAALVAVLAAFFVFRPAPTPGPALRDFESYYAAGVTWYYRGDPYGREVWRTERTIPGVVAARDELLPFVGPPFGLPLWSALGALPWPVATVVWDAILALALGAIAFAPLRLAGGPLDAQSALAVLAVVAGFGPLTSGIALGQVAVVSCAAIAIFPLLLIPRYGLAAAAAVLAAALQPNLAIVLAARLGERRAWIACAFAATVAAGGSLIAVGGFAGFARYLATLRAHAAAERFLAIQTTPGAVARALGASAHVAGLVAAGLAFATLAGIALQCASRRYGPNERIALACAAAPLALPFAHEHDFAIVFFPAILTLRRARGRAWLVAALALLDAGVDWLGLAQRPEGVTESVLLTFAAACGVAALAPDRLRPYHFVPVLVAVAACGVGILAGAHRLPTWPDALGNDFHVPFAASAPEVWHLEQLRSGIGALDPVWGTLRLLSLAACALIWATASVVLARDLRIRRSERLAV